MDLYSPWIGFGFRKWPSSCSLQLAVKLIERDRLRSLGFMGIIIKRTAWQQWNPERITSSEYIRIQHSSSPDSMAPLSQDVGRDGGWGYSYYQLLIYITQSCDHTPWTYHTRAQTVPILLFYFKDRCQPEAGDVDTIRNETKRSGTAHGTDSRKRGDGEGRDDVFLDVGFFLIVIFRHRIHQSQGPKIECWNELKLSEETLFWIRPPV